MLIKMLPLHLTSHNLFPFGGKKVEGEVLKGAISKDLEQAKKQGVISFCPKSPNEALMWEHCPNKATAMEIQRTLYNLKNPETVLLSFSRVRNMEHDSLTTVR